MNVKHVAWVLIALGVGSLGCDNTSEPVPTFLVPEDYATPQEAIDAATQGSSVLIAPGVYTATTKRFPDTPEFPKGMTAAIHVKDNINVIGNGPDGSIIFRNTAPPESLVYGAMLFNTTSASIQNLVFEDYHIGIVVHGDAGRVVGCETIRGEAGIWSYKANSPLIQLCYVAGARVDGILVQFSDPIIEANLVTQCGGGIGVEFPGKPLIYGNVLCYNKSGVVTNNGAEATLVLNAILNNSVTGLATMSGARPTIHGTDFIGNAVAIMVFDYNPPLADSLDIQNNYWGTTVERDILGMIQDARTDSAKGAVVDITPLGKESFNLGSYNPTGVDLVGWCDVNQLPIRRRWREMLSPQLNW